MVLILRLTCLEHLMTFDPLNILLLGVALVVLWRLRSVHGTRTGNEKPPVDPFQVSKQGSAPTPDKTGTIIRFPQPQTAEPARESDEEPPPPVWAGFAAAGSELAQTLEKLAASEPMFSPNAFVEGAKAAYEIIIEAFAKADKPALKDLLSKEVFDGFSTAIDNRVAAGNRIEQRFVGIERAVMQGGSLVGSKASITMQFVSEFISATYSRAGEIVDGDPKQIREVTDVWTFEKDVTSRNPNWKLVATQAQA